jgi:hypothetical protein
MNHPEFSNKKIRDDFFISKYNYRTVYSLFLASLENRAGVFFRGGGGGGGGGGGWVF